MLCAALLVGCAASVGGERGGSERRVVIAGRGEPMGPVMLWRSSFHVETDWLRPVARGGYVYAQGSEPENLYKLDVMTGKSAWVLEDEICGSRYGLDVCDGLVVYGRANEIKARADATGALVWRKELSARVISVTDGKTKGAGSVGILYATTENGDVYCVSTADGAVKWRVNVGGMPVGRVGLHRKHGTPVQERVAVVREDGKVRILEAASGKELWEGDLGGAVSTDPVVWQHCLVVGVGGSRWEGAKTMVSMSMDEKEMFGRWEAKEGWQDAVSEGEFVYLRDYARLRVIVPYMKDLAWAYDDEGPYRMAIPVFAGGQVILPFRDVFDENAPFAKVVALSQARGGVVGLSNMETAPVYGNKAFYARHGNVMVMAGQSVLEAWRVPLVTPVKPGREPAGQIAQMWDGTQWSKGDQLLRGRVLLRREGVANGTAMISVRLLLASTHMEYVRFNYPEVWISCEVVDENGWGIPRVGSGVFSGPNIERQALVVPERGELTLNLSVWGHGVPRDERAMLVTHDDAWIIPKDGKPYFLRVAMGIETKSNDRAQWQGRMELPMVKIPADGETLSDEEVGRRIAKIGPRMMSDDGEERRRAYAEMGEICDVRVVEWYFKGLSRQDYHELMLAMNEFGRYPTELAIEGLRFGSKMGLEDGKRVANTVGDEGTVRQINENIRVAAVYALKENTHPGAVAVLEAMSKEPDWALRKMVKELLEEKGVRK